MAARNSNKKKKGKAGAGLTTETKRASLAPTGQQPAATFSQAMLDDANWSEFVRQHHADAAPRNLNLDDYKSIYVRYKDATRRVKESLRSMVPETIFHDDHVRCFMSAVDYLEENSITNIPPSLMDDLKVAIRVRQRVATSKYDGGDAGHSYFLSVLLYCFAVLRQLKPLAKRVGRAKEEETERLENRFSALSVDEDEDEDDAEENLPSGSVPKLLLPQEPSRLTLEELMEESDREAAILFLMMLDDIMRHTSMQYSTLKHSWAGNLRDGLPQSGIVTHELA